MPELVAGVSVDSSSAIKPTEKLPMDCVYHKCRQLRYTQLYVYLIEWEPGLRTISYVGHYKYDRSLSARYNKRDICICFPRLIWAVSIMNFSVYRVVPIMISNPFLMAGLDTLAFAPPVPNLTYNHFLCLGNFNYSREKSNADAVDKLMLFLNTSVWNDDIPYGFKVMRSLGLKGINDWAKKSNSKKGAELWKKMIPCEYHNIRRNGTGFQVITVGDIVKTMLRS